MPWLWPTNGTVLAGFDEAKNKGLDIGGKAGDPVLAAGDGKVVYAGSHVNAVMALNQGTVDAAANWWNNEEDSELMRMVAKGMVKKEDFRLIFKSDLIPASPVAYLDSLPADLKDKIQQAFLQAHIKNKAAFDKLSDGKNDPFVKVTHAEFEPVVAMNKFVDNLRKKQ